MEKFIRDFLSIFAVLVTMTIIGIVIGFAVTLLMFAVTLLIDKGIVGVVLAGVLAIAIVSFGIAVLRSVD